MKTGFVVAALVFAVLGLGGQATAPQKSPEQTGTPQNPSPMVEHTRAHPRLPAQTTEGRREKLSLGTLFVPAKLRSKKRAPVLFFFHGQGVVPEVAAALSNTVVISAVLGAGSRTYEKPFRDPAVFGNFMSTPEYYNQVANTIMIDGIHTSYIGGKPGPLESQIDPAPLQVFIKLARDAIQGKKRVIITHSEIFPGTFASTTETADYILNALGLHPRPVVKWGPMGTQELSEVRANKFLLVGFAGNSAPDHIDQLQSLPEYLKWLTPK